MSMALQASMVSSASAPAAEASTASTSAGAAAAASNGPDVTMRVINRVAVITLDRPAALNALSHAMVRELAVLVERCRADPQIFAIVLRGAGEKGFCAGGDVRALYHEAKAALARPGCSSSSTNTGSTTRCTPFPSRWWR